jgi:anaerobic selenocysteine-containing dehydrogenase
VVQQSKGVLKPISGDLLSETQIVCRLAKATLGKRSVVDWDLYQSNYDHIRDVIEKVVPGFEDYNKRVRKPGGFYLPNAPREGKFETDDFGDKAPFTVSKLPKHDIAADEYRMTSIRSHDQFNTTIYGLEDRYRGIHNERRVVFMNLLDIEKEGLKAGDLVDIFNEHDGKVRALKLYIVVPYNIPLGNTATYYPENNVLVPISSVAEKSNTPTSKLIFVKIKKHQK